MATAGATGSVDTGDIGEVVAERVRVRAALDRLSERDREVIRLTHWEQLDLASAAQVLECSVTACKVRLHRARRRLAALLDTSSDPEIDNLVRQGEAP